MLFVSAMGAPPAYSTVIAVFLRLARSLGLRGEPWQTGPRIHDLRHTFAVRSLDQCQPDHHAVGRHIVALSTYLGHAHVTDTYWYLQATPILLRQIAAAGEGLASRSRHMTALAPHLTTFLREHLPQERRASPTHLRGLRLQLPTAALLRR
ncbi:hypothetical protein ACOJBO_04130 [Rhizobium beringeri]